MNTICRTFMLLLSRLVYTILSKIFYINAYFLFILSVEAFLRHLNFGSYFLIHFFISFQLTDSFIHLHFSSNLLVFYLIIFLFRFFLSNLCLLIYFSFFSLSLIHLFSSFSLSLTFLSFFLWILSFHYFCFFFHVRVN